MIVCEKRFGYFLLDIQKYHEKILIFKIGFRNGRLKCLSEACRLLIFKAQSGCLLDSISTNKH